MYLEMYDMSALRPAVRQENRHWALRRPCCGGDVIWSQLKILAHQINDSNLRKHEYENTFKNAIDSLQVALCIRLLTQLREIPDMCECY